MPKLMYLLQTADCHDNLLFVEFDNILRSGLFCLECGLERHTVAPGISTGQAWWTWY